MTGRQVKQCKDVRRRRRTPPRSEDPVLPRWDRRDIGGGERSGRPGWYVHRRQASRGGGGVERLRREEDGRQGGSERGMHTWTMSVIQVPLAGALHELNLTPVIHSPINQYQPAVRVVSVVPQQNTLLRPTPKVTHLQLQGDMTEDFAPPHPDVTHIRHLACEQFPGCLGGPPRLQAVVDVHCSPDRVRPELQMQTTVNQHGSSKVVNALDHPLRMTTLLVNIGRREVMHDLLGKEDP
jgi:hypothetical protein